MINIAPLHPTPTPPTAAGGLSIAQYQHVTWYKCFMQLVWPLSRKLQDILKVLVTLCNSTFNDCRRLHLPQSKWVVYHECSCVANCAMLAVVFLTGCSAIHWWCHLWWIWRWTKLHWAGITFWAHQPRRIAPSCICHCTNWELHQGLCYKGAKVHQ